MPDPMAQIQDGIDITFDNLLAEHLSAARACERRSKLRIVDKILGVAMAAVGCWTIFVVGVRWWTILPFPLAVVTGFNLLSIRPLLARIAFARNPKFRERYNLHFSADGISFKTSSLNSQIKWSHYQHVTETDDLFLLFYGRGLYTIVPKRAFQAVDLPRFRELLSRHIPSA